MSYEIIGVMAVSVIALIIFAVSAFVWAVADTIRKKRGITWTIISIIPVFGPVAYYLFSGEGSLKEKFIRFLKSRWPVIAIFLIIAMGMYVRLIDYRWAYLRNIDSYVFYRWMDEIVLNAGVLPTIDVYQLAPYGLFRPPEWIYVYFYAGAYGYMLVSSFVSITLSNFLIYFPPFLAALTAIPLYFIGKTLYDRKAGVLAAFIFVFDINNFSRSLGGDPDNDAFIMLISMMTMAALIFTYNYSKGETKISKRFVTYSILSGLVLWIWYSTWAGYWYIFWLITGFIVLKFVFTAAQKRSLGKSLHENKFILLSFAIYMCLSFALTVPSYGTDKITSALAGPVQFQSIKGEDAQFPNVYVSVAELQQSGGPREIIERTSVLGGPFLLVSPFFLMLYTLAYLLYSYYKRGQHLDTVLLLIVWFFGPFAATVVAVRFSILFSAPLAIGSAILFSKIIRMASKEDKSFGD